MASSRIIRYDEGFIDSFERLREMIEAGDHPALHRYLIESFGFVFETFQYYAKHIAEGGGKDFEEEDEETRRELMRPLSHRQYRMIERSFSIWEEETEDVVWSIWDFLHDDGRIYRKKAMSSAEVSGCSLILEQVYRVLGRGRRLSVACPSARGTNITDLEPRSACAEAPSVFRSRRQRSAIALGFRSDQDLK